MYVFGNGREEEEKAILVRDNSMSRRTEARHIGRHRCTGGDDLPED